MFKKTTKALCITFFAILLLLNIDFVIGQSGLTLLFTKAIYGLPAPCTPESDNWPECNEGGGSSSGGGMILDPTRGHPYYKGHWGQIEVLEYTEQIADQETVTYGTTIHSMGWTGPGVAYYTEFRKYQQHVKFCTYNTSSSEPWDCTFKLDAPWRDRGPNCFAVGLATYLNSYGRSYQGWFAL